MKKILFIFLFPFLVFAQYTKNDSSLVKTTFNKSFDKKIIGKYLTSNDDKKTIAALLSISQSDDTSFVSDVLKLNPAKYGNYMAFTLGQLGENKKSTDFLLSMISFNQIPQYQKDFFDALGKTGNDKTIETLKTNYFNLNWKNNEGIALAIANFYMRGVLIKDEKTVDILLNEFSNENNSLEARFDALYALYRIGGSEKTKFGLIRILKNFCFSNKAANEFNDQIIIYSLSDLRRIKFFPNDTGLFRRLIKFPDWTVRNEAAKTLVYFNFRTEEQVDEYLSLLNDKNPSTSRQTAVSIKDLKLSPAFMEYLKSKILDNLSNNKLTENTKGELFLSYLKLFPENHNEFITNNKILINKDFLYQAFGLFSKDNLCLEDLVNAYSTENSKTKITILESLLKFQDSLKTDKNIKSIILDALSSNSAPLISISADGIYGNYIFSDQEKIKNIIIKQVNKYFNNPDYIESLFSLTNLSRKIDKEFYFLVVGILEKSDLYSVQEFVSRLRGKRTTAERNDPKFTIFWQNAFKYKSAVVKTTKGEFTIDLAPERAPVTAGSFCYLAAKGFYNNIFFHRVVPGFVIQTGDPTGTGWGGPGYEISSEYSNTPFNTGYAGIASAGKDTEGSQWFIMQGFFPHLNGKYTNFGKISLGQSVVDSIDQGDKILSINLSKIIFYNRLPSII